MWELHILLGLAGYLPKNSISVCYTRAFPHAPHNDCPDQCHCLNPDKPLLREAPDWGTTGTSSPP